MTGTYKDNGDGSHTLSFDFTSATQAILDTVTDAVKFIYSRDTDVQLFVDDVLVPFDELTVQQRVDVIDKWIRLSVTGMAASTHINDASNAAAKKAETEADTKYIAP